MTPDVDESGVSDRQRRSLWLSRAVAVVSVGVAVYALLTGNYLIAALWAFVAFNHFYRLRASRKSDR